MITTGVELGLFVQIAVAMILGIALGLERALAGRTAGPRTYGLVSMGACLLTIISLYAGTQYADSPRADPISIVAAVMTGIGFIGAGLIIFHESKVSGLTTAAGIWVSAGIGIAVGYRLYVLAFFTAFLTLFIFSVMWRIENRIKARYGSTIKVDNQ